MAAEVQRRADAEQAALCKAQARGTRLLALQHVMLCGSHWPVAWRARADFDSMQAFRSGISPCRLLPCHVRLCTAEAVMHLL